MTEQLNNIAGVIVFAFYGVYILFLPYFLFHAFRPLTAKEKRSEAKMAALIKRWGDDPDFDEFTADRWFAWCVVCADMGWFKS
jgi:hypothetical protein